MKSVMLSIQPKWIEKIVNGEKTIEVRKSRPKIETPFKCYIYMTATKERCRFWEYITAYQNSEGNILDGSQKVIGEFICDKIYEIKNRGNSFMIGNDIALTNRIASESCLEFSDLREYLIDKDGYGWHISDLVIYDKPKELGNFFTPMGKRPSYMIERPPQSYMYVEEV